MHSPLAVLVLYIYLLYYVFLLLCYVECSTLNVIEHMKDWIAKLHTKWVCIYIYMQMYVDMSTKMAHSMLHTSVVYCA